MFSRLLGATVLASLLAAACQSHRPPEDTARTAEALLSPTAGSSVEGVVRFEQVAGGVRITVDVRGLDPDGVHGFHIHERGDCSAPDATSAGGHFDPHRSPHGDPAAAAAHRHVGDLGNLVADASGRALYERVDPLVRLEGPHAVLGLSIIVHAQRDDLTSQPTGDAGPRLACGLIGRIR